MSNDIYPEATPIIDWRFYLRAVSGGAFGAILALIPVSILKTLGVLIQLCVPLGIAEISDAVSFWTCGITYDVTWSTIPAFILYMLYVILGGALAALITVLVVQFFRELKGLQQPQKKSRGFKRGIVIGMLFDLLFVFVYIYLGQ